nr:Hpt domain-containing protein [Pseudoxanthomonas composti]
MSALRDAMSHAVLGWVKPELDATLRQAREEIELFAEQPTHLQHMQQCGAHLHQVQGTLRMVELHAPALVAEELEALALALQEGRAQDIDEACAVLMRGTVLLPDYLERLQSGHRDIPIVLLPLLNEIRAARGEAGLSEGVLFAPDLDRPLPPTAGTAEPLPVSSRASRLEAAQERLARALQAWPEAAAPDNAAELADATRDMLALMKDESSRRMLWVASSVAEALRDGALQASPAVRQGFASVVRSLRQAQEDKLLSSTPGQEPTRELLYQVANSDAQHPALDDLRSTFGLEAAEPTPAEIEHARSSLTGRNRALLDTVGGAVKEELLRIKDALDLHLRTGGDVAALESQVQHLTSVGETLGMMGLDAARGVVVEQRDALSDLIAGRRSNDEGVLLDIAGALLYVDASLDDQVAGLGAAPGDASDEAHSSEAMRTIEIVAQEAIRNFAAAREAFVAFIETNWNHEQLSDVPRLLGEVSGSLRILDLAPAAAHVDGVRRYVEVELVGNRRVPGGQQLDTLADAMASLEYYLEALRDRRPNREEILDVARASLENLRYSSAGAVADAPVQNVEPAVPALPQADPAAAAEPGTRENAAGEPPVFEWPAEDAIAAPADPALQIERFEAAPESGERLTLAPLELDESAHLADDQVARPEAESARIAPWTLEEDAPGERLELAPLELDDGAHGVEVDASASDEPLDIAVDTSEWTLEIEEDAPSPAPLAWEPEDTLQADGAGDPPPLDFQEALAHEAPTTEHSPTAEPLPPVALDAQVEDAPQATASSQPPSPVGDGPAIEAGFDTSAGDIDDEIRDVFLEELAEEVGSIAALVPHWREDLYDLERMRPIRRTFHTLKGSGRLVGARVLGEFAWKVENMLNRVLDGTRPPSPAVLDLLERSTLVLPQLEAALRGTGAVTADLHGLEAVADRLAEGEEAWYTPRASLDQAEAVAEAQVPPPLPPTDLDGIPASVDSVLREILEAEVQAHLKTVDAWLAMAATGAGNARVNEPLLRAFHTMNGAFAMADVPGITEVTGPAEQFLKRALPTNAPVTAEAVQAIDEAATAIRQAIAALHADAPRIPRFEALNARLVALRDTLPQAKPTVLTVPDLPAESSQEAAQDEIAPPVLDGTLQDMDLSAYLDPAHLPGNQAPQDQATGADDAGAPLATPAFDEDQERAAVQDVEPIEQVPVLDEALSLEEDAPAFAQDDEGSQDTTLHDEAALDAAEQDESAAIPPAEAVEADADRHFRGFELDATYSGRPAAEMTPITGAVALVPADALPEALEPAPAAAADAPAEDILVEEVPAEDAPAEDILVEGVSAEEEPANELPADRWTIAQDAAVEAVTEPQAPAIAIAETSSEEEATPSLESELGPAVFEVSQPVADPVEFDFADGTVLADDAPASLGALDYDTPQDPAAGISLEEAESAVQGEELDAVLAEQAPVESDAAPDPENAPAEAWSDASAQDPEPALQAQEPSPAEDFTWTEPPADVIESIALLPDPDADALTVATDDAHAPDIAPTQPEEAFVVSAQDAQEEAATVEALLGGDDGSAAVDAPQATDAPVQAGVEATAAAESIDALIGEPLPLDELDRDLVDIFVEEGRDLLDHSDGVLAQLRQAPDDHALVAALQRDLHTLKGGARMAGINAIGDLGHAIESLLEKVAANRLQLDRGGVQLLEQGFDGLHRLLTGAAGYRAVGHPQALIAAFDAMAEGRSPAPIDAPASQPAQAPASVPAPAPTEQAPPTSVQEAAAEDAALPTPQAEAPARQAEAPVAPVAAARPELAPLSAPVDASAFQDEEVQLQSGSEQVRVRADLLDRLVNNAGEVAIYRARLEQQLGAFRGAMAELDRTNVRLHDQLRRLDLETEAQIVARYQREQDQRDPTFDPLELDRFSTLQQLSRALGESAADLSGLQGVLDDLARQYDSLLQQQSRVSSELQDGLMQARMVPFEGIVPRLRRTLRQAANDTGKQVRLQLQGTHGELDRNVLERMTAPLEHLLRNALAHGLEAPQARREAGKAEEGLVTIALDREGSEMVLRVSDDGAGLNLDAIRARAEQRGLLAAGSEISRVDLERMILEPGFSTSETVSQLAGRGVGMDVVHNEVRALGGTLDIDSTSGKGTTFTLRLPQTLAVTRAVFVQVGETRFAVPVAAVSGIGRITRDRFTKDGASYVYAGEEYSLYDLGTLVAHNPSLAEGQEQIPLLLVRSGDLRAAVAVDAVLGNREIVVKPVGPQVSSIPGIYGATITGDGSVVVILDAAPLVRRFIARPAGATPQAAVAEQRHVPLVMVVDDSLTMRKVTGRVLERHNFEVVTARDGVEALERLEDRVPDLMLLDIEMPRMDGYELATAMKADARFAGVPIVMITSRSGDKHRQRAFEIGVQRYMGKPYQELDLMRNVYDLLGMARVRE